ncbi:uncharacterized protein LOC135681747 isoform X1 [Rhopilema esculentum]|uniref:uncharacterized protein LOC135681747 isoform X1 n=1 Tax=Rhopilema esculentum TaxID=499914 RepID=UPI0031CE5F29
MHFQILLLLVISVNINGEILRLPCKIFANFTAVLHDHSLSSTFRSLDNLDEQMCKFECIMEHRCKSINLNRELGICQLNNKSAQDPKDFIEAQKKEGWTYHSTRFEEKNVGQYCQANDPCSAGHKCIDTCYCPGYECIAKNIAYKKPSSHSSTRTYDGTELVASFGNDGDRTAEWQRCSFTSYEEQPWWQVDLKEVAAVTHVRITNSIAWSSHDTYPYNVSVGKDSSNGGRNNALCVNNGMLASGEMKTFYCPKLMMGRYVSVFLNRKEFLPVCELEVYEAENLAYKKPSSHSSTSIIQGITLVASFGNDGDRNGDYQRCSVTKADVTPWWQVDLTRQAAVTSVQIKSGATWGQLKINPFDISVGDDRSSGGRNNALCVKDGRLASGELKKFDCSKILTGRYVSVYLNRREYLQVCEVYEGMCLNLRLR